MGKFIKGNDRGQLVLFNETLEDRIEAENEVRVIDMFVDSLDGKEIELERYIPNKKGTNHYDDRDLLKLYLYGYRNGVRSSRKLARLCKNNIEVIWLMRELSPDFRTIADFRKRHSKVLKNVFKKLVIMCGELGMLSGEYSQDGEKIEAVNSKEKNYTLNKIDDRIKRIDRSIKDYLESMDKIDEEEEKSEIKITKEKLEEKLKEKEEQKKELEEIRKKIEESGENQISLTDPESKLMKNNGKFSVCYNNQVLVDSKEDIVVNFEADNNPADVGSMNKITEETKEYLGVEGIVKNITDKGYNDREDMGKCLEAGIIPEVTLPEGKEYYEIELEYEEAEVTEEEKRSEKKEDIKKVLRSGNIPEGMKEYLSNIRVEEKIVYETEEEIIENIKEMTEDEMREYALKNKCFMRDIKTDRVYCPEGEILRKKSKNCGKKKYCNKLACKRCKNQCTASKFKEVVLTEGQVISTSNKKLKENFPESKKKRKKIKVKKVIVELSPKQEDIKRRMGISEHSHGTMKRSDGAYYFLMKGKEKVNAELALYYCASNLRRLINVKGIEKIKEYLQPKIDKKRLQMA